MVKSLLFSAALVIAPTVHAQPADTQSPAVQSSSQQQPAPIIRRNPSSGTNERRRRSQDTRILDSQPAAGIWLRSVGSSVISTVSATPQRIEVRLEHGLLNVNVHHPAAHAEILVDLPGGQVSLLKDGLYTFNSDTNTVRVLHGEAAAYLGTANPNARPIKVKEDHQLSLIATGDLRAVEAYPYELTSDLLPLRDMEDTAYSEYADGSPYAHGTYAGAWSYPYPYGGFYPGYYSGYYGYPVAYGIGFGYFGGFHGGYGYRGGFRR